ncbi:hypothetical protein RchiOBHm_Chr3g0467491 [Rosa chinensis]|uniref:Uncharacterized protein n=1 Tax=Rosa chinensis TaxID=74649 RepID=A0A2P6RAA0_ROSCH|nr:hypothetical protein RchiOBHm_Chr3g0467491 [Rosa chinensis]
MPSPSLLLLLPFLLSFFLPRSVLRIWASVDDERKRLTTALSTKTDERNQAI